MTRFKEIASSIYSWPEFSEDKQLNFNGFLVFHQVESVLIDPPSLDESGVAELQSLLAKRPEYPLKAILLTNGHHDRMSQELKEKLSVPIVINEKDADLLDFSADQTFRGGETTFCGMRVIGFENQKSPGESAFLLADQKILIVGDALIGRVPGKVNMLPPDKFADIEKAKTGLQILRDVEFDTLLVGDGEPILANAKQAVIEFLD